MDQTRSLSISQPLLQVNDSVARVSVVVRLPEGPQELWFTVPAAHADKLTLDTCDAFVIALYPAAAQRHLSIRAEGAVSRRLLHSLNGQCGELLQTLLPRSRKVRVIANESCAIDWGGQGVYAGFSAGIDSFCTLLSHTQRELPRELRLSGLFYNNVGSHGHGKSGDELFRMRQRRVQALAAQLGLPLIHVSSNLDSLLGLSFQHTHTLRNVAVALLFQKVCGTFLYSSLVHYRDVTTRDVRDISYADAILLPLLRTETLTCHSAGSEHTRFEKTRIVSQYTMSHAALDVCVGETPSATINCSACWKCLRTQLTLELLGELERYHAVFQLERYRHCRTLFIASVLQSRDALSRDIAEQIAQRGFPVPLASTLLARLTPPPLLRSLVRRYARAFSRRDAQRFAPPSPARSRHVPSPERRHAYSNA